MPKNKYRFPLLIIAFVLLIIGAILQYKDLQIAWAFIGVAVVLYVIARIFMRDKSRRKGGITAEEVHPKD